MCIDGDVPLPEKKRTNIIKACGMVCMLVGKQQGIHVCCTTGEHLLPKIWAAVHNKGIIAIFYHDRNPKPFIFRVLAQTYGMLAAYNGDSLRSTGA